MSFTVLLAEAKKLLETAEKRESAVWFGARDEVSAKTVLTALRSIEKYVDNNNLSEAMTFFDFFDFLTKRKVISSYLIILKGKNDQSGLYQSLCSVLTKLFAQAGSQLTGYGTLQEEWKQKPRKGAIRTNKEGNFLHETNRIPGKKFAKIVDMLWQVSTTSVPHSQGRGQKSRLWSSPSTRAYSADQIIGQLQILRGKHFSLYGFNEASGQTFAHAILEVKHIVNVSPEDVLRIVSILRYLLEDGGITFREKNSQGETVQAYFFRFCRHVSSHKQANQYSEQLKAIEKQHTTTQDFTLYGQRDRLIRAVRDGLQADVQAILGGFSKTKPDLSATLWLHGNNPLHVLLLQLTIIKEDKWANDRIGSKQQAYLAILTDLLKAGFDPQQQNDECKRPVDFMHTLPEYLRKDVRPIITPYVDGDRRSARAELCKLVSALQPEISKRVVVVRAKEGMVIRGPDVAGLESYVRDKLHHNDTPEASAQIGRGSVVFNGSKLPAGTFSDGKMICTAIDRMMVAPGNRGENRGINKACREIMANCDSSQFTGLALDFLLRLCKLKAKIEDNTIQVLNLSGEQVLHDNWSIVRGKENQVRLVGLTEFFSLVDMFDASKPTIYYFDKNETQASKMDLIKFQEEYKGGASMDKDIDPKRSPMFATRISLIFTCEGRKVTVAVERIEMVQFGGLQLELDPRNTDMLTNYELETYTVGCHELENATAGSSNLLSYFGLS